MFAFKSTARNKTGLILFSCNIPHIFDNEANFWCTRFGKTCQKRKSNCWKKPYLLNTLRKNTAFFRLEEDPKLLLPEVLVEERGLIERSRALFK